MEPEFLFNLVRKEKFTWKTIRKALDILEFFDLKVLVDVDSADQPTCSKIWAFFLVKLHAMDRDADIKVVEEAELLISKIPHNINVLSRVIQYYIKISAEVGTIQGAKSDPLRWLIFDVLMPTKYSDIIKMNLIWIYLQNSKCCVIEGGILMQLIKKNLFSASTENRLICTKLVIAINQLVLEAYMENRCHMMQPIQPDINSYVLSFGLLQRIEAPRLGDRNLRDNIVLFWTEILPRALMDWNFSNLNSNSYRRCFMDEVLTWSSSQNFKLGGGLIWLKNRFLVDLNHCKSYEKNESLDFLFQEIIKPFMLAQNSAVVEFEKFGGQFHSMTRVSSWIAYFQMLLSRIWGYGDYDVRIPKNLDISNILSSEDKLPNLQKYIFGPDAIFTPGIRKYLLELIINKKQDSLDTKLKYDAWNILSGWYLYIQRTRNCLDNESDEFFNENTVYLCQHSSKDDDNYSGSLLISLWLLKNLYNDACEVESPSIIIDSMPSKLRYEQFLQALNPLDKDFKSSLIDLKMNIPGLILALKQYLLVLIDFEVVKNSNLSEKNYVIQRSTIGNIWSVTRIAAIWAQKCIHYLSVESPECRRLVFNTEEGIKPIGSSYHDDLIYSCGWRVIREFGSCVELLIHGVKVVGDDVFWNTILESTSTEEISNFTNADGTNDPILSFLMKYALDNDSNYASLNDHWRFWFQLGEFIREMLLKLRHMGAMSSLSKPYQAVCDKILSIAKDSTASVHPAVKSIIDNWLKPDIGVEMNQENSNRKHLTNLRRSAGLPLSVKAILSAEAQANSKTSCKKLQPKFPLFNFCIDWLIKSAADSRIETELDTVRSSTDLHQVHSINICRSLLQESNLSGIFEQTDYLDKLVELSISLCNSKHWSIRNSSHMLFTSCFTKLFGVGHQAGIASGDFDFSEAFLKPENTKFSLKKHERTVLSIIGILNQRSKSLLDSVKNYTEEPPLLDVYPSLLLMSKMNYKLEFWAGQDQFFQSLLIFLRNSKNLGIRRISSICICKFLNFQPSLILDKKKLGNNYAKPIVSAVRKLDSRDLLIKSTIEYLLSDSNEKHLNAWHGSFMLLVGLFGCRYGVSHLKAPSIDDHPQMDLGSLGFSSIIPDSTYQTASGEYKNDGRRDLVLMENISDIAMLNSCWEKLNIAFPIVYSFDSDIVLSELIKTQSMISLALLKNSKNYRYKENLEKIVGNYRMISESQSDFLMSKRETALAIFRIIYTLSDNFKDKQLNCNYIIEIILEFIYAKDYEVKYICLDFLGKLKVDHGIILPTVVVDPVKNLALKSGTSNIMVQRIAQIVLSNCLADEHALLRSRDKSSQGPFNCTLISQIKNESSSFRKMPPSLQFTYLPIISQISNEYGLREWIEILDWCTSEEQLLEIRQSAAIALHKSAHQWHNFLLSKKPDAKDLICRLFIGIIIHRLLQDDDESVRDIMTNAICIFLQLESPKFIPISSQLLAKWINDNINESIRIKYWQEMHNEESITPTSHRLSQKDVTLFEPEPYNLFKEKRFCSNFARLQLNSV